MSVLDLGCIGTGSGSGDGAGLANHVYTHPINKAKPKLACSTLNQPSEVSDKKRGKISLAANRLMTIKAVVENTDLNCGEGGCFLL